MSATEDGKRARKAYLGLYATGSGRSSEFQADLDAIAALTLNAKRWEEIKKRITREMPSSRAVDLVKLVEREAL